MVRLLEGEDTDRMDALSDGVFAIVLTLLVLQFQVPDADATGVPAALADQRPLLFSYLLSFAVVGLYWIVHHNLFQRIVRHDRVLLYLNLLFLLTVSFLPFPTELLGIYGTHFTWTLYALNFSFVGLSLTLLWWYAYRRGFTDETVDHRTGRLVTVRGLISPVVFLVSVGVATVSLSLAFVTPILIVPLQMLWARYYERGRE
ncbi:TMEM175 family protein [Halobacteria archaeon AArc-m2/3/4]|uniref:TMEM175 family protein n=1 Tax=Natronoglomus mannanivorans TaxID=2979990 RepID=A0ABT2QD64_9EURY|nr:TMEM175 family protein [Halobacteria archaeon AArc-m2/3/4]